MKRLIKGFFEFFGFRISRLTKPDPHQDAFEMQKNIAGNANVIFDVGAYVGEVALVYKHLFPGSKIYSFEPFPESYQKLKENVATSDNIIAINKGLTNQSGKQKFYSNKYAPTNSLLAASADADKNWGKDVLSNLESIQAEFSTIDEFVEENNIAEIDILKMDVQGAEHLVLKGAERSLSKGLVKLIYTEIITRSTYEGQAELDVLLKMYKDYGFELFSFYNYSNNSLGQLRHVDAIFVRSAGS